MGNRKFLVTGATGETGRSVVNELIGMGHHVRALAHAEDQRADGLRNAGAEVVIGDMLSPSDVAAALVGIDGAYFVYPIRPGLVQATTYFAKAARDADLEVVVNMSQIAARENSPNQIIRDHWFAERILDWSGTPVVHLRPTFFLQWLLYPHAQTAIIEKGMIDLPWGNATYAPIAPEDLAQFIATVLNDPRPHIGKTHELHGAAELNQVQLAAAVGEALGVPVRYQPLELDEYRRQLAFIGFPELYVEFFVALANDAREGIFSGWNDLYSKVTGKQPLGVQEFIRRHRSEFAV